MSREMDGDRPRRAVRPPPRVVAAAPDARIPTAARARDAAPVTFVQHVDGAYHEWSVVEVDARAVPGARGARCLVFTRESCIRRVWDYPADWRALDATGLTALSWHR